MLQQAYPLPTFTSSCEGPDCQGCEGCPEVTFGYPVQHYIDEIEALYAKNREKDWKEWGYSPALIKELHKVVNRTEELTTELADAEWERISVLLQGEPQFMRHVREVKVREGLEKLPALLQRADGETLLYAGKLNSVYGEPGTGKSWLALITANEVILGGGRGAWWDFEDSPDTLARRGEALGALTHLQDQGSFLFVGPSLQEEAEFLAREELAKWLAEAPNSFVVIDAAESAGCPSDGADVAPWFRANVDPWLAHGVGVVLLDHVPKQRLDRPKGGIGSQHKLARIDGAALYISGVPWTKQTGGSLKLTVHKDRQGDLPAAAGQLVATLRGEYKDGYISYSFDPPSSEDAAQEIAPKLLDAIATAGLEGVRGSKGIRELVKGRGRDVDAALNELISNGMVERAKGERNAFVYRATIAGHEAAQNA